MDMAASKKQKNKSLQNSASFLKSFSATELLHLSMVYVVGNFSVKKQVSQHLAKQFFILIKQFCKGQD